MEENKYTPKDKDLRDWINGQCDRCDLIAKDGEAVCIVLGEEFGGSCRNDRGELCRYYYQ